MKITRVHPLSPPPAFQLTLANGATAVTDYPFKVGQTIAFAEHIADCMNAEAKGADAIVWTSDRLSELKALSPKVRDYGWAMLAINTPLLLTCREGEDLALIHEIKLSGRYAEDLHSLRAVRAAM